MPGKRKNEVTMEDPVIQKCKNLIDDGDVYKIKDEITIASFIELTDPHTQLEHMILYAQQKSWDQNIAEHFLNIQNEYDLLVGNSKKRARTKKPQEQRTSSASAARTKNSKGRDKTKPLSFFNSSSASASSVGVRTPSPKNEISINFNQAGKSPTFSELEQDLRLISEVFEQNDFLNVLQQSAALLPSVKEMEKTDIKRQYLLCSLTATLASAIFAIEFYKLAELNIEITITNKDLDVFGLSENFNTEYGDPTKRDNQESNLEKAFFLAQMAHDFSGNLPIRNPNQTIVKPFSSLESIPRLKIFVFSNLISYYDNQLINCTDHEVLEDAYEQLILLHFDTIDMAGKISDQAIKEDASADACKALVDLFTHLLKSTADSKDLKLLKMAFAIIRDLARFKSENNLITRNLTKDQLMAFFKQANACFESFPHNANYLAQIKDLLGLISQARKLLLPATTDVMAAIKKRNPQEICEGESDEESAAEILRSLSNPKGF